MKKRYYKEISRTAFDFVWGDAPIELVDFMTCYDVESFDYRLVLKMKNVSGKAVSSVEGRFDLYDGISAIPYKKLTHIYKKTKKKLKKGEDPSIIGENEYVPLPQSYFKDIEKDNLNAESLL